MVHLTKKNNGSATNKETLSNIQPSCSSHMKTAITALLKKFEYAENALNANIGNGVIGRINFN